MGSQNRVQFFLTRKSLLWLNFLIDVLSVLVSFPIQSHEKESRGASFQLGLRSVNLSQVKMKHFLLGLTDAYYFHNYATCPDLTPSQQCQESCESTKIYCEAACGSSQRNCYQWQPTMIFTTTDQNIRFENSKQLFTWVFQKPYLLLQLVSMLRELPLWLLELQERVLWRLRCWNRSKLFGVCCRCSKCVHFVHFYLCTRRHRMPGRL